MFYETERIIRKQQRYVNSKACTIIKALEGKGLNDNEITACIDVMLSEDNTESKVEILNHARKIVTSRKETESEESPITIERTDAIRVRITQ